jgi:predicted secreted protein
MRFGTLAAIYFVVWWVILFAVLPFGIHTQDDDGEVTLGTPASAPVRPMLLRKALATTIAAAVIVGGFWAAVQFFDIDIESIARLFNSRP